MIDEISFIAEKDDGIWGSTYIEYSGFGNKYTSAIVVAEPYSDFISMDNYNEEKYNEILKNLTMKINRKIELLKELFDKNNIKNYVPQTAQRDEIELKAEFSFKYAAVKAGMGWIGKSGVLITRKFGPRVRLGVILVDYDFKIKEKLVRNLCGNCTECIEACPHNFINGITWDIETKRKELLEYKACNMKRKEYLEVANRKHECGYCLLACPWGIKHFASNFK
jgi:epoxyqueuosine reductase QueG